MRGSGSEFQRLKALALKDPAQEPAMLAALLSTPVYVHVPAVPAPGKTQLVCWDRPDGVRVIPFFSEADAAMVAMGPSTRVARVVGAELFASAPGGTFMLDPNGAAMTLYPEEVAALLDGRGAAIAPTSAEGPDLELLPPTEVDRWLMDRLIVGLSDIPAVQRVHLATARPKRSVRPADRLLVIVAVPDRYAERVARALAVVIQIALEVPRLPIDLATYVPEAGPSPAQADGLEQAWTHEFRE